HLPGDGTHTPPTVGREGEPQEPGHHNLRRKRLRLPRSELERARLAAHLRENGHHHEPANHCERERGTNPGGPSEGELDALSSLSLPPSEREDALSHGQAA